MTVTTGSKLFNSRNNPQLVYYATQVVAGINYNMVFQINSVQGLEYYCATVFEQLPAYGGKLSCTNYEMSPYLDVACKNCHAFGEAEKICNSRSFSPTKETGRYFAHIK